MSEARIITTYDKHADVLYVVLGEPQPVEGEGRPNGVELDFSMADGAPCAATIIGLNNYGWRNKIGNLSTIIANHLHVDKTPIRRSIEEALTG